jgi:hypothetical protein
VLSRVIAPVPGVLDVIEKGPYARLVWGPLAGILRWQELSEWKRDVSLVVASDLTDERCAALGIRRPAAVIGDEDSPTRAAVAQAPAYCVDGELFEALLAAGCRLCRVGYHRGSGELFIERFGPGWTNRRIELVVGAFRTPGGVPVGAGPGGADLWIDRVLRAETDGLLGEAGVRAAVAIREHVDDLLACAEARERRAVELAEAEAFARDSPELAEEYAWMYEPSARFSSYGRDDELRARLAKGAPTRPLAEALVRALDRGTPPTRVFILDVGWIPILRESSVVLRVRASDGASALPLPAARWAVRQG